MRKFCRRGHAYSSDNVHRHKDGTVSCKECRALAQRSWAKRNPDSIKNTSLKQRYGIDLETYTQMFEQQNGVCAISGMPPSNKMLAVDHDHLTGGNRALLHGDINVALGLFQENPEWLRKAADYIEYWRKHERPTTSRVGSQT